MSREQRELLLIGIRLYLNHLWTMVAPSPERNNIIRVLQMLKGKLLDLLEEFSLSPLPLSMEEQMITRDMLNVLIQHAGNLPELSAPEQRAGLVALKTHIEWSGSV